MSASVGTPSQEGSGPGLYLQDLDEDNLADAPGVPGGWLGLVSEVDGGIVGYVHPGLAGFVVDCIQGEENT